MSDKPIKAKSNLGNSMKQVSEQTGIPIQHLKIVKVLFPEGFKANNGLDVKKVTEYYESNKDFITEFESESLDSLKKIEKAIKIQTDELKLAEKKRLYIKIADEKEWLTLLVSTIQSILLAKVVNDLQSRIETTPSEKRADIGRDIYNETVTRIKELVKKKNG
jgi:hypothetical protein